jgi:hypothetical protein
MSYLFIKICFKEKSLYFFHKKFKIKKKTKKIFFVGFLDRFLWVFWVFLGGFFSANPAANPPTRTANPPTRNGRRLGGRGDPAGGPAVALCQLTGGGGRGGAVVVSLRLQDQLGDLLGALVRHLAGQQLGLRKLVPIPGYQQPEALCWMRNYWAYFWCLISTCSSKKGLGN